ncbi:hypothetical protein JMUB7535_26510 [Staphylococcus aureus]
MTKNQNFIETKEYKRFAEFCDACIKYQYIGICYGQPGVGKTLSSRYYTCLLYTSPSPRDMRRSRMPSSA